MAIEERRNWKKKKKTRRYSWSDDLGGSSLPQCQLRTFLPGQLDFDVSGIYTGPDVRWNLLYW